MITNPKNNTAMTLHEAMIAVLKQQKTHSMHRKELAEAIEKQGLYEKGDKSAIDPNQISARASKHPAFNLADGIVSLI